MTDARLAVVDATALICSLFLTGISKLQSVMSACPLDWLNARFLAVAALLEKVPA